MKASGRFLARWGKRARWDTRQSAPNTCFWACFTKKVALPQKCCSSAGQTSWRSGRSCRTFLPRHRTAKTERASRISGCPLVLDHLNCFLPPVVEPTHCVIRPVIDRRIVSVSGIPGSIGGRIAAPVERRTALIKSLGQPGSLLRADRVNRQRSFEVEGYKGFSWDPDSGSGRRCGSCGACCNACPGANCAANTTAHGAADDGANQAGANCIAHRLTGLIWPFHPELVSIERVALSAEIQ